jgi:polyferredoxin
VDHYLFVRNTSDLQSHITLDGWAGTALCGAQPVLGALGWTLGKYGSSEGCTLCPDCVDANRERVVAIGLERGWNARQMAVVLRGIEEA